MKLPWMRLSRFLIIDMDRLCATSCSDNALVSGFGNSNCVPNLKPKMEEIHNEALPNKSAGCQFGTGPPESVVEAESSAHTTFSGMGRWQSGVGVACEELQGVE